MAEKTQLQAHGMIAPQGGSPTVANPANPPAIGSFRSHGTFPQIDTPPPQESTVAELQQQIESLKKRLAQSQQMAALGELTGTTTHEFNNLLMTVINYAKMGLRHRDDPTREKAFSKILEAGDRAAKVTATILGMAKNRKPTREPTDLGKVVSDALMLLEREMSKYRVRVELDAPQVPLAMVNGNQVQQILLNLMINARQAMPSGGQIHVAISHDAAEKMVDLIVRDSGSGIPQDKLPHIFDAFYSTKDGPDESGKGGTGLGLSACRDIVQAHGGRIRVQSSIGAGTVFTIKFPIAT